MRLQELLKSFYKTLTLALISLLTSPLLFAINNGVIVSAQQIQVKKGEIKATIVDNNNVPLIGVNVLLKKQKTGYISDLDGNISIQTKESKLEVEISYVGFKTKKMILENGKYYKIVLEQDSNSLGDAIVTGFMPKSKNSFTGSQTTIDSKQLLSAGTKNALESIQAFVPGMQIAPDNSTGSDPNSRPDITIRGRSSFEGAANLPIFVVDGSIVPVDYIYDMDLNDIEAVTVLKDASASALYGAKASAGVIVITTKTLKGGKLKFNYSGTMRVSMPDLSEYHLLNAKEKLNYERLAGLYSNDNLDEQYRLDKQYAEKLRLVNKGLNTDWLAKPLRNGLSHNHNISIDGGDDYARYTVGLRYGDDNGVMKGSRRERISSYYKLSYYIANKMNISNSSTLNIINSQDSPYGDFSQYTKLNPYDSPYDNNGELKRMLSYRSDNPLYEASLGSFFKSEDFNFMNNTDFQYWFLPSLRLNASFSFIKYKLKSRRFTSPLSKEELNKRDLKQRGSLRENFDESLNYSGKLMFSYNKTFFQKAYLSLTAGSNVDATTADGSSYTSVGYFSDKLSHPAFANGFQAGSRPSGSDQIDRSVGFFINANTIYDSKYFFDVIYRYEGSSKFGKNKRFSPFWSFGLGWNIHNEEFLKDLEISTMKLRASIGYLGNVGFSPYQALTTYRYESRYNYGSGVGAVPITIGNPDLKWERTLNSNIGLDLNILKNRLDLTLDFYMKNTDNLLLNVSKAPAVGVSTARENIGAIENKGMEIQTRIVPIMTKDLYWALSVNYSYNQNKIKHISNALKKQNEENLKKGGKAPLPIYEEGQSLTAMKVVPSAGIDPITGQEVYIKKDGSYSFIYDSHDKVTFGDTNPFAYGRIGSYLTYKQFSFNMQFSYSLGGAIYNQTLSDRVEGADPRYNADARVLNDRWKKSGDIARYKNISNTDTPQQTSRFVEIENYIDLKSISLAYDFNEKQLRFIGLNRLRLEFLMNDLFYFSSVKRERGLSYPFARSFEFNVRFSF